MVSLILFFDGANYTKSNHDPLHAFFSTIAELPPILRNSTRNIITHSLWSGSTPNFNVFLRDYNKNLEHVLRNGIYIDKLDLLLHIRCYVFIADAPERASLLNMNRFNGKFSCIMCLAEGENLNKNKRGNNFKFPNPSQKAKLRTETVYAQQVNKSIVTSSCVMGIKGASYLSEWLVLPTCTIIDYMHACLLGTTKHLMNMWLSTTNRSKRFYLRSKVKDIDKLLIDIKYPTEFSRLQRTISNEFSYFKASEFRNIIFYVGLPLFKEFLPSDYYIHFVKYIIFMRLLCNSDVQIEDIKTSFHIITEFINDFEKLYGSTNMTFNLHSHIHLPHQVMRFGPLHLLSAFAFEGMLKFCGSLLHGTRGFANKLGEHLAVETFLNFEADGLLEQMEDPRLKSYCSYLRRSKCTKTGLLGYPVQTAVGDILNIIPDFLIAQFNLNFDSLVTISSRASFENTSI